MAAIENNNSSHSSGMNANQVSKEENGLDDLLTSMKTSEKFIYKYRLIVLFNLLVDLIRCREKGELFGRIYAIISMYRPEGAAETLERLRPYYEDIKFLCISSYNYFTGKETFKIDKVLEEVDKIPDLEVEPHGAGDMINEIKDKIKNSDKVDGTTSWLDENNSFLKFILSVITIFSAIFGCKALFDLGKLRDKTKDFVNSVNTLKAAKTLYGEVDSFSDSILSTVYELMGKEYVSPKLKHVKELSDKIEALHQECNAYIRQCRIDFFGLMRNFKIDTFRKKYETLNSQFNKLTESEKSNYNFTLRLQVIYNTIEEIQQRYLELVASSCGKQTPTVLWISGLPGVGKTRLVNRICSDMAQEYGMPYARTWSEEFWSNYQLQPICTMDDMLQHTEGKDLMEFHMYTSEDSKNIVGAALQDKGKPFVSRFLFVTSNYNWIAGPVKLTDLEALNRRRHFVIYMHHPALHEYKRKNNGTDPTDEQWWRDNPARFFLLNPIYGATLADLKAVRNLKFDEHAEWVIGEMTLDQIITSVKEREKFHAELYRQRLIRFIGDKTEFPIPTDPITFDRSLFDISAARASITDGSLVSKMITFAHHTTLKPNMLGPSPSVSSSDLTSTDYNGETDDEDREEIEQLDNNFLHQQALANGFNNYEEYQRHLIQEREREFQEAIEATPHAFGVKVKSQRYKYGVLLKGDAGVGKTHIVNTYLSDDRAYFVKYDVNEMYPSDKVLVFDDFIHSKERKAQFICALIDYEKAVLKNPCIIGTCNTDVPNYKSLTQTEKELIKRRCIVASIKYKKAFRMTCKMTGKNPAHIIRNMDQHQRNKNLVCNIKTPPDNSLAYIRERLEKTWDGVANLMSWCFSAETQNRVIEELEVLELPQPAWPDIIIRVKKNLDDFEPQEFFTMKDINKFHITRLNSNNQYVRMSITEVISVATPIINAFGKTSRVMAEDPRHYTMLFNAKKIKCPNFPHMYIHFDDCQFGFVQAPIDDTVISYYVVPDKYESDMRITDSAIYYGNEVFQFDTPTQKRFLSAIKEFAKGDIIKPVEKPNHEEVLKKEFLKSDMSKTVQFCLTLVSLLLAGGSVLSLLTPVWKRLGERYKRNKEIADNMTFDLVDEDGNVILTIGKKEAVEQYGLDIEGKRGKNKRAAISKNPVSSDSSSSEKHTTPPANIKLYSSEKDLNELFRKNYYNFTYEADGVEIQDMELEAKIKRKQKTHPIRDANNSSDDKHRDPPTRLVLKGGLKFNAADYRPVVKGEKDRFCLVYTSLYDCFGVKYLNKIYYLHPDNEGEFYGRTVQDSYIWTKVEHPKGKNMIQYDHIAINSIVNQLVLVPRGGDCNADSIWAFAITYGEPYDFWNDKMDWEHVPDIFNEIVIWPKFAPKNGVAPEGNRLQYHSAIDPTIFNFMDRMKPAMCELLDPKTHSVLLRGVMLRGRLGVTNNHCPMPALMRMAFRENKLYQVDKVITDAMHDVCIFEVKDKTFESAKDITSMIPSKDDLSRRVSYDYGSKVCVYVLKYLYNDTFSIPEFVHTMAPAEFNVRNEQKEGPMGVVTFSYDLDSLGLSGCSTYGDCGSVIMYVDKTLSSKWCAILSAGSRDITVARYFTREYIHDLLNKSSQKMLEGCYDTINHIAEDRQLSYVPNAYLRFFEESRIDKELGLEWIGRTSLKVFHPTSTLLYQTGMYQDSGYEPTLKSKWDPRNPDNRSMFKEGLKRYTGALSVSEEDQLLFIEGAMEVGKELGRLQRTLGLSNRILTQTEAINRLHNWESPFSRHIDRSGSVGFPWVQLNPAKSRKCDYLEMRGENWYFKPRDQDPVAHEIMNLTNEQFCDLYRNKLHLNVAIPYLKDETVPLLKIYDPVKKKTRIFFSLPMPFLINYRRLFASPMWRMPETMYHHPIKVGINCTSHQWQQLYYSHAKVSTMGFASDMSNWDGTLPLELIRVVPIVWNTIFKMTDQNWKIEDDIARFNLHRTLEGAIIVAGENIYRLNQAMLSGCPGTAIENSIINWILYYCCFKKLAMKNDPSKANYMEFRKNVALSVYGDDNFCTVHPDCQSWFHFNSFREEALKFGIVVTSTAKDGKAMPNLQRLEELEFLKRNFRMDQGYVLAPLAKTSIIKSLAWIRDRGAYEPKKDPPHFLLARNSKEIELNVIKACIEMSLHGKEEYEKFLLTLEEELIRIKLMVILPTWQDALAIIDFYVGK